MVVANNKIEETKNAGKSTTILMAMPRGRYWAIRSDAHRLMECIRGFMRSYYMPPSGECPHHIAPAAAMVYKFAETT